MYASISHFLGNQSPDLFIPSTVQQHNLGMTIDAHDPNFYGTGRFIYSKAVAAMNNGRLCYLDYQNLANDIPNTANTGFAACVSTQIMAINTFGWFQIAGLIPVQTAASVAAGVAVGVGAAGQAGTNAAGKQLLGVRVVQPSTYAPTKTIYTQSGSKVVNLNDSSGLIPGLAVTGTGIAGSSTIVTVNSDQRSITLNNAATASGAVTGTFTWTGFLLLSAPMGIIVQGAIT